MTSPKILISIDPAKRDCGIALFKDGRLYAADLLRPKDDTPFGVARAAEEWVFDHGVIVDTLIVEGQQIYPGAKENPNDLLPLAQCIGGCLARIGHTSHKIILPRMWTNKVPKDIRVKKFWTSLDADEAAVMAKVKCPKSKIHNVIDAVCLGKWAITKGY